MSPLCDSNSAGRPNTVKLNAYVNAKKRIAHTAQWESHTIIIAMLELQKKD